jgi:hypothetical protein
MEDHYVNRNINYKKTILNSYVKLPEGTRGQHLLCLFWDVAAVANPRNGCGGSTPPSGVSQLGEET